MSALSTCDKASANRWGLTIPPLRWFAILLSTLFLAGVDILRHLAFAKSPHTLVDYLSTYAAVAIAVVVFAHIALAFIARVQRELAERNQQLSALGERAQRRERQLGAMIAMRKAVASSISLDNTIIQSLEVILQATSADAAGVWLVENCDLVLKCHQGACPEAFIERTRLPVRQGASGLTTQAERVSLADSDPSHSEFLLPEAVEAGFQTFHSLPLQAQGQLLGILGVAAFSPNLLKRSEDISFLAGIGDALSIAIENARLRSQVQDTALLEERVRTVREVHDRMAQLLAYTNAKSSAVRRLLSDGQHCEAAEEMARMEEIACELYADVREGILGLGMASHPIRGLLSIMQEYVGRYRAVTGLNSEVITTPAVRDLRLSPAAEIQLMRIVQEALTNVRKHARATAVQVVLERQGNELLVDIADNGQGFDATLQLAADWPRLGLRIMQARAQAVNAAFAVATAPGKGTRVSVRLPLLDGVPDPART